MREVLLAESVLGLLITLVYLCLTGKSWLLKSVAKGVRADSAAGQREMNVGVCPDKDSRRLASITLRIVS